MQTRICITETTTSYEKYRLMPPSALHASKIYEVFCQENSICEIEKILEVNTQVLVKCEKGKGVVNYKLLSEDKKCQVANPPTGKYFKYGFVDILWNNSSLSQIIQDNLYKENGKFIIEVTPNILWTLTLQEKNIDLILGSSSSITTYVEYEEKENEQTLPDTIKENFSFYGYLEKEDDADKNDFSYVAPKLVMYRDNYSETMIIPTNNSPTPITKICQQNTNEF